MNGSYKQFGARCMNLEPIRNSFGTHLGPDLTGSYKQFGTRFDTQLQAVWSSVHELGTHLEPALTGTYKQFGTRCVNLEPAWKPFRAHSDTQL